MNVSMLNQNLSVQEQRKTIQVEKSKRRVTRKETEKVDDGLTDAPNRVSILELTKDEPVVVTNKTSLEMLSPKFPSSNALGRTQPQNQNIRVVQDRHTGLQGTNSSSARELVNHRSYETIRNQSVRGDNDELMATAPRLREVNQAMNTVILVTDHNRTTQRDDMTHTQ